MLKPLRIVIYRPQAEIWFRNTLGHILRRQKLPNKYGALFSYLLQSRSVQLSLSTSLHREKGWRGWRKYLCEPLDLLLWCLLNHISLRRVKLVFSRSGVQAHDVLLSMYYGDCTFESAVVAEQKDACVQALADLCLFKVVNMTHYVYNPHIGVPHLQTLKPDLLVAENNLAKNSAFFKQHFAGVKADFSTLSYTPAARFVDRTPFRQRVNKLVATGTLTFKIQDAAFQQFYQVDELQPLRRKLFERAGEFRNEMECLISDLNASRAQEAARPRPQLWQRVLQRFTRKHPQAAYFRKDIVSIYNKHMMFAVPEEICDLPPIAFVEGMACGAAYLGIDSPMYRDLGMVPGQHYIAYDGTVDDLMCQVRFYQAHLDALEVIARNGHDFVRAHLMPDSVYADFVAELGTRVDAWRRCV